MYDTIIYAFELRVRKQGATIEFYIILYFLNNI